MTCWLCGFKTTELVTNAEIPSCKNGPCSICIAVANVDEEINQAVATLRRLIAKRLDLRSEQNRAHDPMHRLPLELRHHIFEMVLPKQDQWGRIVERMARTVMPSRLASICRNWRDVAWSNPSLWSTIRINVDAPRPPSMWIPFVQNWILRSQTSPLTLRIDALNVSEKVWGGILDVISPSSNRWQSLYFSGPDQRASHLGTFHYDRLRRLQIIAHGDLNPVTPVTCFDTTVSPEEIYISCLTFQELQISWNHLTSATVDKFCFEEIVLLFQHASQMAYCHLMEPWFTDEDSSKPPIIHQSLTTLRLSFMDDLHQAAILFGSLTLPSLQEFDTDEIDFLTPGYLPALVHRSSSPLTSISLDNVPPLFNKFQPWPGITSLVLSTPNSTDGITRLLLEEEYFPDLRYLTLRLKSFLFLWNKGFIRKLLDRKGSRPDSPKEGRLHKLLVVEEDGAPEFDQMWNSDVGEQLKGFNIRLREDGFEIMTLAAQNTQ